MGNRVPDCAPGGFYVIASPPVAAEPQPVVAQPQPAAESPTDRQSTKVKALKLEDGDIIPQ